MSAKPDYDPTDCRAPGEGAPKGWSIAKLKPLGIRAGALPDKGNAK